MSAASAGKPAPAVSAGRMIATLGLVAGLCGLLIVSAHLGTQQAVAENKRIAVERAVRQVIPQAARIEEWRVDGSGRLVSIQQSASSARRFFSTYDAQNRLAGLVLEGAAKGYADQVRLLFAWQPDCQCITGFALVVSRETPGIGDKIVKDRQFLANFTALQARLNDEGTALAQRIETVKPGTKTQPWQIDAISGATITSRAVGRAIDEAANVLLPTIVRHKDLLDKGSTP